MCTVWRWVATLFSPHVVVCTMWRRVAMCKRLCDSLLTRFDGAVYYVNIPHNRFKYSKPRYEKPSTSVTYYKNMIGDTIFARHNGRILSTDQSTCLTDAPFRASERNENETRSMRTGDSASAARRLRPAASALLGRRLSRRGASGAGTPSPAAQLRISEKVAMGGDARRC
ncbi:hypothetical protein EVAR_102793_1 [Eumeta japonica]|uniref:Uncharacterized protein n=1 Tax=Eumeta variegata TaxID=151549 RepID=A0A4C1THY7_EUMVA|nr:hypothetical protein EVAR_102793_1 [Eumeta japonica]